MTNSKHYYAYLARCADDSLYAGYTDDIAKREKAHNDGLGAKYTKSRRPVKIVYFEEFDNKTDAMSREWHLKRLTRVEKLALVKEFDMSEDV